MEVYPVCDESKLFKKNMQLFSTVICGIVYKCELVSKYLVVLGILPTFCRYENAAGVLLNRC